MRRVLLALVLLLALALPSTLRADDAGIASFVGTWASRKAATIEVSGGWSAHVTYWPYLDGYSADVVFIRRVGNTVYGHVTAAGVNAPVQIGDPMDLMALGHGAGLLIGPPFEDLGVCGDTSDGYWSASDLQELCGDRYAPDVER